MLHSVQIIIIKYSSSSHYPVLIISIHPIQFKSSYLSLRLLNILFHSSGISSFKWSVELFSFIFIGVDWCNVRQFCIQILINFVKCFTFFFSFCLHSFDWSIYFKVVNISKKKALRNGQSVKLVTRMFRAAAVHIKPLVYASGNRRNMH